MWRGAVRSSVIGWTAFWCPSRPGALANAIAPLLVDADLCLVMRQTGRDMAERDDAVSKIAGATLAPYHEPLELRRDGEQNRPWT